MPGNDKVFEQLGIAPKAELRAINLAIELEAVEHFHKGEEGEKD